MQLLGEAAASASHDLNNLLTAISGQVDMLAAGLAPQADVLPVIRRACDRASVLTRSMLRCCRRGVGRARPVDLGELVRQCEPLLHALVGRAVALSVIVGSGPYSIEADPTRLEDALFNLTANAREAMPDGGDLRFEVFDASPREHEIPGRVVLRCSDTGCGMDVETRSRAFKPYFTTKESGTGQGLAQVREAVREAGGDIQVGSLPGQGTCFEIFFPRYQS
jgi:signal transduction histidine kinase